MITTEATQSTQAGIESAGIQLCECAVEDGALTQVPVYETHPKGKNWLARIDASPASPGGLARSFQPNGRGRYYYLVAGLSVGDAVEIAADYGERKRVRWYGNVLAVTADHLTLDRTVSAKAAIDRMRAYRATQTDATQAVPDRYELWDDQGGTYLGVIEATSPEEARARFAARIRVELAPVE